MLENMTTAWRSLLSEYGWETLVEEPTWCTTRDDGDAAQITIEGKRALRASAQVGFKVLGTLLTFDNKMDTGLEHRLSRANEAFYTNWELLCVCEYPFGEEAPGFQVGGGRCGVLVRGLVEPHA